MRKPFTVAFLLVMPLLLLLQLAAIWMLVTPPAYAQEVSLKSGENADLGNFYWIRDCRSSLLISFAGVDLLEGPPGIVLSIREEDVQARRQNCPSKVPGGVVVVTAKDVPSPFSGVLRYRVRYNTSEGQRESTHSTQIKLIP